MIPDCATLSGGASLLAIDIGAIVENWRLLQARTAPAACAAVVKADAYGLGMAAVTPALAAAGCRLFFVAQTEEAVALRALLPQVEIAVLNGFFATDAAVFRDHSLIPVLNELAQVAAWRRANSDQPRPAILQFDTGMSRLGLTGGEAAQLAAKPELLAGIVLRAVMSHLACADEPAHPLNLQQLAVFRRVRAGLPGVPASLAASSAIFLGPDYHFDLVRPGAALYGVNPQPGSLNPMRQVVRLKGKILQTREIDMGSTVGYGATYRQQRPGRIATVGLGYADGLLRSLGNRGTAIISGRPAPIVGRVSMDLITLDVTDHDQSVTRPGDFVELIGPCHDVDALATEAGTTGYEILTALGRRFHRVYVGGSATTGSSEGETA